MSPTDRELLRENILLQCHSASRKGVRFNAIVSRVRYDGYDVKEEDVDGEVRYLEGKNLIKEVDKRFSPENRRYVSTPEGTDYLRKEGLV